MCKSVEKKIIKERCSVCGKPVEDNGGYHGTSLDHYECHARRKLSGENMVESLLNAALGDGWRKDK